MRVTIKGLTDSTITFNTIGIIIRGNSAKPSLYPNSIATHIDIVNDEQMRELVTLKNAKLISVTDEAQAETEDQKTTVSTQDIVKVEEIEDAPIPVDDLPPELTQPEPIQPSELPEVITPATYSETHTVEETVEIEEIEEIEDMPKTLVEEDEDEILTIASKNLPETSKTAENEEKTPKIPKIKSVHATKIEEMEAAEPDSTIVVMTANGPMEGKAVHNMAGELPESKATQASIEALRKMDEEEEIPDSIIDESKLDPSEQMGGKAIIATGESDMVEITMKNSILPHADAIKERGIKFIDPSGEDGPIPDDSELDESIKNIFIDDSDIDDDVSDNFIEI